MRPPCSGSSQRLEGLMGGMITYLNTDLDVHVRLKAAIAAAQYVHPKLAVTAVIQEGEDFALRLERAMVRSTKILEIQAEPLAKPTSDPRLPVAQTDRRYRR